MSWVEALAVAFGVLYLLLAVREHNACWYAAFCGTGLSIWLFWSVSLPMESALNVYYLLMAVYGWWQWQQPRRSQPQPLDGAAGAVDRNMLPREKPRTSALPIRRFRGREHALALGTVAALTLTSGTLLHNTDAALPYLDSFTTWGSVVATWMVAKKVLENWLYWLVIDAASIVLYLDRELYLYAGLFALYLVIVVVGWRRWRDRLRQQTKAVAGTPGP